MKQKAFIEAQVAPITLEKRFVAASTFEGLCVESTKNCSIPSSVSVFFASLEKKTPYVNTVYLR